jgi:hypothetical protein
MKLGRGLAVMFWLIPVYTLDFIGLFFGFEINSAETNILLAFILAWCNDE